MVKLINTKLYFSSIGALFIILGYIINKNSKKISSNDEMYVLFSKIIYILGWLIFAFSIGITNYKTYDINLKSILAIIGVMIILFSFYEINEIKKKDNDKTKKYIYLCLYFFGWLTLSFAIYYKSQNIGKYIILGLLLIFISLLYFLPKQRDKCMVDGIGAYLLISGWLCLVFANSKIE